MSAEPYAEPVGLFRLPPGLPLPESGKVIGEDDNYDLRDLFRRVMGATNSNSQVHSDEATSFDLEKLDKALKGS
jgi:hypothetical protein